MKRFKSIAVLLGETHEDDRVLKRAVELAEQNQATLSVYAVFDKTSVVPDTDTILYKRGNILRRVKKIKQMQLDAATASLQGRRVTISGRLLTGKPFICVIQEVLKKSHDLLMLPAEKGRTGFTLFYGSTPMNLLRNCPCAVWVFSAQRRRKFRKIMAAVDVVTWNKEEIELNIKIMELATSLALQEDAELHIVHCSPSFSESIMVTTGSLTGEARRRYALDWKKHRLQLLHSLIDPFPIDDSRMHIHLPKGEAGDLIPKVVAKQGIDLLVMGTVARSGIPGFFIGNTAEKILNYVSCTVLTIKPDGFVSPIQRDRS